VSWASEYGEWVRSQVEDFYEVDQTSWVLERALRVSNRLQGGRAVRDRKTVVVLVSAEHNACTLPGSHIYISRRLFERCATDDMLAMIVAHEIAHHDLGHLALAWPQFPTVSLLQHALQVHLSGVEYETAADLRGVELCKDAGYDPYACLKVFEVFEAIALDYGYVDGVTRIGTPSSKKNTHPPIRDRERAIRRHLKERSRATWTEVPFRSSRCQVRCTDCDADAPGSCHSCRAPVCAEHQESRVPCPNCDAAAVLLCRSCHTSNHCALCDFSLSCQYCDASVAKFCDSCSRGYCGEHFQGSYEQCANCRLDNEAIRVNRVDNAVWISIVLALALLCYFAYFFSGSEEEASSPPRNCVEYVGCFDEPVLLR